MEKNVNKLKKIWDKIDDAYWWCHRNIRDEIFAPIWYRFFGHKLHIIKTSLRPAPWIETDTRILYAVMDTLKWFVEHDMDDWIIEHYEEKMADIEKIEGEKVREVSLQLLNEKIEGEKEILDIITWWNNYNNRLQGLENALDEWIDSWGSARNSKEADNLESPNPRDQELFDKYTKMEQDLLDEEQEYLIRAIKIRHKAWS